jgi:hypothetical protein
MSNTQCIAVTQKKHQCKNNARYDKYCFIHIHKTYINNKIGGMIDNRVEKKILIACHDRSYDHHNAHWQKHLIENIVNSIYVNETISPQYETIDIIKKTLNSGPDIVGDIFNFNPPIKYDVLFLPDCGGDWYESPDNYIKLIPKLFNVINDDGYIYLGKLIYFNKLIHALNKLKLKYRHEKYDLYGKSDIEYIILRKPIL